MVETNGYKERLTLEQDVGISLDADDCFADKLYDYYINIKTIDDILMFLIGHWQSQKMLIETYDNPQRVNFVIFDFY